MKDNTAIAITGICTIGCIEIVALLCGHNGTLLLGIVAAISAICAGAIGYKLGK